MSIGAAALRLLRADADGAADFVANLPEDVRSRVPELFAGLKTMAFDRMLIEPDAFLRFKAPAEDVVLSLGLFRDVVDALIENRSERVREILVRCSLEEAFLFLGVAGRILEACRRDARNVLHGSVGLVAEGSAGR